MTKGPTSLKPMAAAAPARSPTVPLLKLKAEEKEKAPSPPPPVPVKAKESGMLDWSKAKSKETKKEAPSAKQVDRKVKQEKGEAGPSAKGKAALKDKEDQKVRVGEFLLNSLYFQHSRRSVERSGNPMLWR